MDICDCATTTQARKNAARLQKQLNKPKTPDETGVYQGDFNEAAPQGSRYTVRIDPQTTADGEFLSPSAPPEGTRVAIYKSAPGQFLFDCL